MNLAIFDFDGTITAKGTYPDFVRFAVHGPRKMLGGALLSPLIAGYRTGLVSDRAMRRAITKVAFWLADPDRVFRLGEHYANDVLPRLVRPHAAERIAWHKAQGDRVVIVSASLDVYLSHWCRSVSVDLICTRLQLSGGVLTGRYIHGDCCAEEKARRIQSAFILSDYSTIYAYGDSEEDREMLELANRRYFRWHEIDELPPVSRKTRRGDFRP
jgi:HAD superfamily hydrolase (TIGR01490 family)